MSPFSHLLEIDEVTGETEAGCWLAFGADGMLGFAPANSEFGSDIGVFPLPPMNANDPTPAIAAALFATPLVDTPEVRKFMEFVSSPEWGEIWATDPVDGFVSANRRFAVAAYGTPGPDSDPWIAFNIEIDSIARTAVEAGVLRFDASDLMPPGIGGGSDGVTPGAFWQGMLDWVDGVRSIDEVFADIDEEWAALK